MGDALIPCFHVFYMLSFSSYFCEALIILWSFFYIKKLTFLYFLACDHEIIIYVYWTGQIWCCSWMQYLYTHLIKLSNGVYTSPVDTRSWSPSLLWPTIHLELSRDEVLLTRLEENKQFINIWVINWMVRSICLPCTLGLNNCVHFH